jgi:hypothetical protein
MGLGDTIRNMAGKVKDKVGSTVAKDGVDAAAAKVDSATGNKYESEIDKGRNLADQRADQYFDEPPQTPNR